MNPEENTPEDAEIGEAIATLMQELPKPVQDFLVSEERNQVARDLSAKYHLHVDQAGEFERAFLFMLLGITSPTEFVSTLTGTGLPIEVVNGLASDVNARVFVPLRDAQRAEAARASAPAPKPAPLPPPSLDYHAAPTLPGSPVPAPMPVAPVEKAPEPVSYVPAPQHPAAHESPAVQGWHPAAAIHIYAPSHGAPYQQPTLHYSAASAQPAGEPPAEPKYRPRSESASPRPASDARFAPVNDLPAQPRSIEAPRTPIRKEYPSDPYREPIQ